jgi:L-alanine-DL-glutamate epimerase-like enolase superfamily enzyme
MKIVGVDLFPLRFTAVKPGYQARQRGGFPAHATVIVRIGTDGGVHGLGEATTGTAYFNQTPGALVEWLRAYAAALQGADPLDIVGAHRIMDAVSGEFPPGCQPARAAIDMALHDLAGKAYRCPVYQLLGGAHRTSFELLTSLYESTPDEAVAAARQFVAAGYRGLKIKVGAAARANGIGAEIFRSEIEKLVAILEALPDTIYVDADANQAWKSAKIAVRTIEEVLARTRASNLSLEQPVHHLDLQGHRYIRDALKIPLILDESVLSPEAMLQIARVGAADRIVLKPNRVGGLLPARRIATICEAGSIGISIDTTPLTLLGDTANCHLAATLRDAYPVDVEGHLWFEEASPFSGGLVLQDGKATIGDAPGFGIELDPAKLEPLLIPLS